MPETRTERIGLNDRGLLIVRDVLASLELESRATNLAMRVEVADEALGSIRTDRFRLRQILVNIVANAIKFTESGSIVVSLRASEAASDAAEWTIDIAHTGVGIAPEQQTHLFELFEQANPSITRQYGGNGLGLAISRKLAEQLGGALVLVHSTPGAGTTFRLTLRPLTPPPQEPVAALRRRGCAVPVIALAADPATRRRAEALDAGCDACLSKPFKVDDLIASIRLSTRVTG